VSADFAADFFDGRTSRRYLVRVSIEGDTLSVRGEDVTLDMPRAEANIRPRLGRIPVRIALPGGQLLVARDFEGVDASLGVPRSRTLAHRLESHTFVVLVALMAVVVGAWLAYAKGIPWASREIAARIPPQVEAELSRQVLQSADATMLRPSGTDAGRRAKVSEEFSRLLSRADVPQDTRLEFRNGMFLGANALTLPGGVIVITDELLYVLGDREVAAILAHELGHVRHRHGMRHVLNNSLQAFLAMAVYGDLSAVAGIAASVPTLLVNTGYSREFEREADRFALDLLKRSGRSPYDFSTALEMLRYNAQEKQKARGGWQGRLGYLETHPDIEERIEAAEKSARPGGASPWKR
jgi:Zn-dependent protease with chaperone function